MAEPAGLGEERVRVRRLERGGDAGLVPVWGCVDRFGSRAGEPIDYWKASMHARGGV